MNPTKSEVAFFSTWTRETRQIYSPVGRKGGGDSYGALQIPYMLAKFVFPLMKYEGFVGLTLSEASAKNMEYRHALKDHWKALKVQRQDAKGVHARAFELARPLSFVRSFVAARSRHARGGAWTGRLR